MAVMGVGKSEWPGSDEGQDNITCAERGAILRSCLVCEEGSMSAQRARNMCKVQALQSKLSHAAKQSLDRKFGALYDKIYREDVVLEAW